MPSNLATRCRRGLLLRVCWYGCQAQKRERESDSHYCRFAVLGEATGALREQSTRVVASAESGS